MFCRSKSLFRSYVEPIWKTNIDVTEEKRENIDLNLIFFLFQLCLAKSSAAQMG